MELPNESIQKLCSKLDTVKSKGLFDHMFKNELLAESDTLRIDETGGTAVSAGTTSARAGPSSYDTASEPDDEDRDELRDRIERDGEYLEALVERAQRNIHRSSSSSYMDLPPKRDAAVLTVPLPGLSDDVVKRVQYAYDKTMQSICRGVLLYKVTFQSAQEESRVEFKIHDTSSSSEQGTSTEASRFGSSSPESKSSDKEALRILTRLTQGLKLIGRSNPNKTFNFKIGSNGITYDDVNSVMESIGENKLTLKSVCIGILKKKNMYRAILAMYILPEEADN